MHEPDRGGRLDASRERVRRGCSGAVVLRGGARSHGRLRGRQPRSSGRARARHLERPRGRRRPGGVRPGPEERCPHGRAGRIVRPSTPGSIPGRIRGSEGSRPLRHVTDRRPAALGSAHRRGGSRAAPGAAPVLRPVHAQRRSRCGWSERRGPRERDPLHTPARRPGRHRAPVRSAAAGRGRRHAFGDHPGGASLESARGQRPPGHAHPLEPRAG